MFAMSGSRPAPSVWLFQNCAKLITYRKTAPAKLNKKILNDEWEKHTIISTFSQVLAVFFFR